MLGSFQDPETIPFEIESYMMSVSINVYSQTKIFVSLNHTPHKSMYGQSPFLEPYTTYEVSCVSADNAIGMRTKFGYLQAWIINEDRTDDSLSCDEVPTQKQNLHDNAELAEQVRLLLLTTFSHCSSIFDRWGMRPLSQKALDINVRVCNERGPATVGFFEANCKLGDG
jgi:hypothetical protein